MTKLPLNLAVICPHFESNRFQKMLLLLLIPVLFAKRSRHRHSNRRLRHHRNSKNGYPAAIHPEDFPIDDDIDDLSALPMYEPHFIDKKVGDYFQFPMGDYERYF